MGLRPISTAVEVARPVLMVRPVIVPSIAALRSVGPARAQPLPATMACAMALSPMWTAEASAPRVLREAVVRTGALLEWGV